MKSSFALGTDVAMLVRALRQTEEGFQPGGEELVKKLFVIRSKPYKYGSTFSRSDWIVVCRNCDWISVKGFTQGDAEMVPLGRKSRSRVSDDFGMLIWFIIVFIDVGNCNHLKSQSCRELCRTCIILQISELKLSVRTS